MRPSDWRRTVAEQGGDRKPRTSGENPLMAGAIAKIGELGRFGRFWKIPRALAFLRCRRFDSMPLLDEREQSRICLKVSSLPKNNNVLEMAPFWGRMLTPAFVHPY